LALPWFKHLILFKYAYIVILFIYQDLIYLRSQRVCMIEEMEQNISCHAEHSPDTNQKRDFMSQEHGFQQQKHGDVIKQESGRTEHVEGDGPGTLGEAKANHRYIKVI
jgi:hypothetical protein